jgi:hypothetical protein
VIVVAVTCWATQCNPLCMLAPGALRLCECSEKARSIETTITITITEAGVQHLGHFFVQLAAVLISLENGLGYVRLCVI